MFFYPRLQKIEQPDAPSLGLTAPSHNFSHSLHSVMEIYGTMVNTWIWECIRLS